MSTLNIWRNRRALHLVSAWAGGLALLVGLLLTMAAARPVDGSDGTLAVPSLPVQNHPPDEFSVITHTTSQERVAISGDCVAFRDGDGGVYLHNLTTRETFTITDKPDDIRKVVVSQGVVVWRSEREGEKGLWGYYNPACSDAGPFTSTGIITPFYIVSRAYTHAPELSGEMLVYMAWVPAGMWNIGLIELDANDNGIPDATEPGYDPFAEDLWVRLSCCASWPQGYAQVLPDIYWGDDYKVACWWDDAGGDHLMCYDLSHDADGDGVPDWQETDPSPWTGQCRVTPNTELDFNWQGVLAVHGDVLIWSDACESSYCGNSLYILDLDPEGDGALNCYDGPGSRPAQFVLVDRPWGHEFPDLSGSFAVWTDRREDIYAYDLSLDSDGNGTPNWQDPHRPSIDPADFRVTLDPMVQTKPRIWNETVVWQDDRNENWDIYGALLEPRVSISRTSQEKALYWLDQQTVLFPRVQDIPGYDSNTGMVLRYKSPTAKAWYEAITGTYVIGYDFCHYGTPDQKAYLGRYGRGFIYDQGLAIIARSMVSQPAEARDLVSYMSSFQNSGQLSSTTPGSFGFSFNGQGYGGEKDNFYDMDYLRVGANAWLGYGMLFYGRQYDDVRSTDPVTRVADYILGQQVITPTDPRHGLFTGGAGGYAGGVFTDTAVNWVATEHNIDTYFFLRDLGQMMDENRYADAAELLRDKMPTLWDETKGRLNQGMDATGTLNTNDALDAASWGAMYWTAVGDLEKAKRSLEYADHAYSNTVMISPTLSIWGYKPYSGTAEGFDWSTVDVVWSEGSLGVAMAHLKLGHALLDRGDPAGGDYIEQAEDILAEMEKLQAVYTDTYGGLLYVVSSGGVITDFPKAPSAAGTTWLLMVQQAMKDKAMRDAFWGPDQALINRVVITGPMTGWVGTPYTFTATVDSLTATLPITYFWQASGQDSPTTHTSGLSDTVAWSWTVPGTQLITLTATNARDTVIDTHAITTYPCVYLPIVFKNHTA
ncbi:MAG TPA: hypothetical protein VMY40_12280 [Anaerolineae bacterium]|nr:hypothetical protein [Anaerolineae bacterium]